MIVLAALLAALSVVCVTAAFRPIPLHLRISPYLEPQPSLEGVVPRRAWSASLRSFMPWVIVGMLTGTLIAQGDLFLAGGGRSVWAFAILGGASGWLLASMRRTARRDARIRRLRDELPVVVDALALQVVSGESVSTAIDTLARSMDGVAADELGDIVVASAQVGLDRALIQASRATAHSDARRLYETLAHAHLVGGRLADALSELAKDFRAGIERDITTESGRRAVATYGPVLALMVPTALLFLLYPTLLGLRALGGAP